MDDGYDHMEEIGLSADRQVISGCRGLLTPDDSIREICARYLRDGGRVFDMLSKYEELSSLYPEDGGGEGGGMMRTVVSLLRANGATDHGAYTFYKENLRLMPGADRAVHYLRGLEPFFINTGSLEHHMMNVTESLGITMAGVNCSRASFDLIEIGKNDAKELREFVSEVAKMDPNVISDLIEVGLKEDHKGWGLLERIDSMITERIPEMEFFDGLSHVVSIGSNEKSYALLEIRNQTEINFDATVYVGSSPSDNNAMDIIRDTGGLAVSFNGSAEAVWGSNVAVMSPDSTVIAVLAAEFYDGGIESVFDLIGNWSADFIRKKEGPDRHLLKELIRVSGKRFPEVVAVNDDNREDIARRSEIYRKKVSESARYRGV